MTITATTHDTRSAIADTWKIERVYSPVPTLRRRDRQEAGDGDQRAGEHRERRARVGEARGAEAVEALLQLDRHHLDRDDRVVDEQAQRQDQRAERDLVQADVEQPHAQERGREHQRDRHRDDEPGAQAEAQSSDTASTISTASASERTNWLTERCTALRHARDRRDLEPDRQRRCRCARPRASSARPSSITSPPLTIVTPMPSASRPWKRIRCCGGST